MIDKMFGLRTQIRRFPKASIRVIRNEVFNQRTNARIVVTKWSKRLKKQILDPGKTNEFFIDLVGELAFGEMVDGKYLIISNNEFDPFFRPLFLQGDEIGNLNAFIVILQEYELSQIHQILNINMTKSWL